MWLLIERISSCVARARALNTSSGDARRVIQELIGEDEKYLRLGYYVRNPDKDTWRWGQSAPLIQEEEYNELVKRAKKAHIMS